MKNFYLSLIALAACVCSLTAAEHRADYNVIPLPKEVTVDDAHVFTLQPGMGIAYDANNEEVCRNARFLRDWVEEMTGIELLLTPGDYKAAVKLTLGISTNKGESTGELTPQQEEAYVIIVVKKGVTIQAHNPVGFFRATQTLRKSLPVVKDGTKAVDLPYAVVKDEPRFEYRGVLLDCGRHFFSIETIKTFLDVMALHGSNQCHWHLTEDQGWRFEVKAYPSLAPIGSVRQETVIGPSYSGIYDGIPYGGYYTQDDCREVVRYAAERYINVVPEIDLPGHMQSALHVFPHLGCTGGPYPVRPYWGLSHEVLGVPYCKLLE